MIIKNCLDFINADTLIFQYNELGYPVYISLEGNLPSGSIKYNTAYQIIKDLEDKFGQDNLKKYTFVESSSGNLAVALAQICIVKGYKLIIIADPLISELNEKKLRLYGVKIIKVKEKDNNGGYLQKRIEKAQELVRKTGFIWTNQYENPSNPRAHYNITAKKIYKNLPNPEYIFIGAGTCGTLLGVSKYYKERSPNVKIIGVDVTGSVAFGGKPGFRRIPGMGTSRTPTHLDFSYIDDVIWINEEKTIRTIRRVIKETGIIFGGSTGTVLSGIEEYFKNLNIRPKSVLMISPDFGDKYIDLILNWEKFKNGAN